MKKNFSHFKIFSFPSTRAGTVTMRFLQKTMTAIPRCAQTTYPDLFPVQYVPLHLWWKRRKPSLSDVWNGLSLEPCCEHCPICLLYYQQLPTPSLSPTTPPKKQTNKQLMPASVKKFSPYLLSKSQRKTYFCCKDLKTFKFHVNKKH